ncbi:MAG: C25 family cysteine peptidase [bacterium]|nr:C25 family cysteine peptidase [bacterium]
MKKLTLPLTIMCLLWLGVGVAGAGITTHTYYFDPPRVEISNGQTTVLMDGAQTYGRVGEPLLPHAPLQLLLPPGEEAVKITVETGQPVILGDGYRIPHRMQPYPLNMGPSALPTQRNEAIYSSDELFPVELVDGLQSQFMRGHGIAYASLNPVSYRPVSGELGYYPSITVRVESRPSQKAQEAYSIMLDRTHETQERLTGMIQNPEVSPVYGQPIPTRPDHWDMLFVTPQAFVSYYQDFVNYKNRSGILTNIVTTEYIYANYQGADYQAKIRNCIRDYYTNYDITYVFLAGDNEQVPNRPLWCNASYTDNLPGDLYYAGLDGTWNNDGDAQFGEPGEEDYVAEVYVGRSTADNAAQIANVVNKYMKYETQPIAAEIQSGLMVGEDLGWTIWAWSYKEEIRLGASTWGYTTAGFPQNMAVDTLYERAGGPTWSGMTNLLPKLNRGPNLVNHLGHASPTMVMKFNQSQVTDVNLTNDGINHNFWIGYSQGCDCGAFENNDCILETFTNIAHGAVAFVGNSRYGWGDLTTTNGPSQNFDRQYFDALFAENKTTLAIMNQDSKEDNIWLIPGDNTIRWCYYELNLFGDPTLDVWTANPAVFAPNFPAAILLGSQTCQVSNLSDGALVTISKDNEALGQGTANAGGVATVTFYQPLTQLGTATIMVTKHNMLPYSNTLQIIPPAGPYVIYSSSVIQDTQTGNGNHQLDYSETVKLDMTVQNVGISNATGVNLKIRTADPLITISDSTEYLGTLNAGASGTVNNAFQFASASSIPDGHSVNFTLLASDASSTWESYFVIVAHAPVAAYTGNTISDPAPGGNNNHAMDPGETGTITVTITNEGTSTVNNLMMTLTSSDAYVTIGSGAVNLGTVIAGGTATGSYNINALPTCPQNHAAQLNLSFSGSGSYSATDDFSITVGDILNAPTGPDSYGYSAYDPWDAPELPVYSWVEISADSSGPGTMIAFTLDDQALNFDLPFTFRYYGQPFTRYTVGANGWVAMGDVTADDYSNSAIPNTDGPEAMIAAYWEDLSPQRTNSGKVWSWYDATNHRLIVEYNHIEQYAPVGNFETFQIILLDPAYYPTQTGDGRIKVQYKQMSASLPTEGTIGIENPAETTGLQYCFDGARDSHAHPITNGFAILYSTPVGAPPLVWDVNTSAVNPPITIPANGGSFQYNINVHNMATTPQTGMVWNKVRDAANTYTQVFGPVTRTLPGGATPSRVMSQTIAGTISSGTLYFISYIGTYPSMIQDSSFFTITKSTVSDGGSWIAESYGSGDFFNEFAATTPEVIPEQYSLGQNYPNPFNPVTSISFNLPQAGLVKLTVFDVLGREVTILVNGMRDAGTHSVTLDASGLASGVYLYKLEAGDYTNIPQKAVA